MINFLSVKPKCSLEDYPHSEGFYTAVEDEEAIRTNWTALDWIFYTLKTKKHIVSAVNDIFNIQ